MRLSYKSGTLSVYEVLKGKGSRIHYKLRILNISDFSRSNIRMVHRYVFLCAGLMSRYHHKLAASGHFHRACPVFVNGKTGFLINILYIIYIHRNLFKLNMRYMLHKAFFKSGKIFSVFYGAVINIYDPFRL